MNKDNIVSNLFSFIVVAIVAIAPVFEYIVKYFEKGRYNTLLSGVKIIIISWLIGVIIEYILSKFFLTRFNMSIGLRIILKSLFGVIILQSILYFIRITIMAI